MTAVDFIGDIHGHADELEALLVKLGYTHNGTCYRHPDRQVLFVGDYIDRGPRIRETLHIVRSMVENGAAIALMGNHEFNAICFNHKRKDGGYLREHSIKNITQHMATLLQFKNRQDEYDDYIRWFRTLPAYFETDTFRAVHATWDHTIINFLKENDAQNIFEALEDQLDLKDVYRAFDITLKGRELRLPQNRYFKDKDGHLRTDIRIKWWLDRRDISYSDLSIFPQEDLKEFLYTGDEEGFYDEKQVPVFFGHYWLNGMPNLYRGNICCLDYSVAKGGYLVAYRFDGEQTLDPEKFVFVQAGHSNKH